MITPPANPSVFALPGDEAGNDAMLAVTGTAEVNGTRLAYSLDGDPAGPLVVLLHGWPETRHAWHRVTPILTARGYRVLAPDLRGLGDSARAPDGYDVRNVAEDIHQLVAQLGYQQIPLVGHDLGAWVGYAYAAAYPGEVSRLVVADAGIPGVSAEAGALMSPEANVKTWHFAFNTLPNLPEALVTGREEVYLRWLFEHKAFDAAAYPAEEIAYNVRAYSQAGAMTAGFAYYRAIFQTKAQNLEFAKTKLAMPVLALGGETGVGPAMLKTMQGVATDVRGVVLDGCGHYLPDEQPEKLAAEILAFFEHRSVISSAGTVSL